MKQKLSNPAPRLPVPASDLQKSSKQHNSFKNMAVFAQPSVRHVFIVSANLSNTVPNKSSTEAPLWHEIQLLLQLLDFVLAGHLRVVDDLKETRVDDGGVGCFSCHLRLAA